MLRLPPTPLEDHRSSRRERACSQQSNANCGSGQEYPVRKSKVIKVGDDERDGETDEPEMSRERPDEADHPDRSHERQRRGCFDKWVSSRDGFPTIPASRSQHHPGHHGNVVEALDGFGTRAARAWRRYHRETLRNPVGDHIEKRTYSEAQEPHQYDDGYQRSPCNQRGRPH